MANEETARMSFGMRTGIIISGILGVIGIALWLFQAINGLAVTDMRDLASWGLYITNFMFWVGLSAGGLIISSVPRVFGIKGFGGISKVAIWTSVCCTILAAFFVVIDLGNPLRLWELLVYSNFGSPLMWDIIVITSYLTLSIIYLSFMFRFENGKTSEKTMFIISTISLATAILVHSVTAWIFGLDASHEFWNTALLAPWFVVSALVSGLGIVLIAVVFLKKIGYLELESENIAKMMKLLGVLAIVDLYFLGADLLTTGYSTTGGAEIVATFTTGVLAPYFWFEVIAGILAIAICFTPKLRTPKFAVIASALAILGILSKRFQLLMGGFQNPNIELSGFITNNDLNGMLGAGVHTAYAQLVYFPTAIEFGIAFGITALGVCVFLIGTQKMNLRPKAKQD